MYIYRIQKKHQLHSWAIPCSIAHSIKSPQCRRQTVVLRSSYTKKKMKGDVNTNTAYGSHVSSTVHKVGTNKEMEGDVVEMRANTSYDH